MVVPKLEKVFPISPKDLQFFGEVWRNLESLERVLEKSGRFPIRTASNNSHHAVLRLQEDKVGFCSRGSCST